MSLSPEGWEELKRKARETIVIRPEDDGKSFVLEEKKFLGATYRHVMIPRFKEGGKVELVFEDRFSGPLWPFYVVGMPLFYALKDLLGRLRR